MSEVKKKSALELLLGSSADAAAALALVTSKKTESSVEHAIRLDTAYMVGAAIDTGFGIEELPSCILTHWPIVTSEVASPELAQWVSLGDMALGQMEGHLRSRGLRPGNYLELLNTCRKSGKPHLHQEHLVSLALGSKGKKGGSAFIMAIRNGPQGSAITQILYSRKKRIIGEAVCLAFPI